jgi:hypothetical protein
MARERLSLMMGTIQSFHVLACISKGRDSAPGCCYDFGMGDEEEVSSEDEGWIFEEHNREIWMEFNWDKIKQDERFTREGASWTRMLPQQPPTRELWFLYREEGDKGEESRGNSVRIMYPPTADGKGIGETWNDVRWYEAAELRTDQDVHQVVRNNEATPDRSRD